ncbi:MAG: hypothetical protein DRJ29_10860 [Bacteroidetes bacterium]|nr:MAG: hypothetical protein DRJ29_10860 [Bacteroidota bacterium]
MDSTKYLPKEQKFAWTAPGWVLSKVLKDWPGQIPSRRQRLDETIKSERFVVHVAPYTLQSASMFPKEITRGFSFSEDVCKQYGLPIARGAKTTAVSSHDGFLATVLATPVYLRGEEIGKSVNEIDNKLTVELGAYAPDSFILSSNK